MVHPSIPSATYRFQFRKEFTFEQARQLVGYLHDLGISHVYCSPIFKASPGSPHGYDISDHNQINPELGTREDFNALSGALRERGMGLIVDFVPNHMGIAQPDNVWWMDVLENGPSSPFASYFDIDWHPVKSELSEKVLLPILGDQYGRVLERGELKISFADGAFTLHYWETKLPVSPRTTRPILQRALGHAMGVADAEAILELESILTAIEHLPSRAETTLPKIIERSRERLVIRRRLTTLCAGAPAVQKAIEQAVQELQEPGDTRSYDALDELLNAQSYRLAYWRVAGEEINYRRFFDINSLAAIRMELPEVFDAAHELLFELLDEGSVTGVRIDHVDGLFQPRSYLEQLQTRYAEAHGISAEGRPLYLIVEKILGADEHLRADWPVHGTTGYEFAAQCTSVLIDPRAEKAFSDTYRRFIEGDLRFHDLVYRSKLLVMRTAMASEVNVLGHMLNRLSETNRWYRDFTLNSLIAGVREVIACFPVYRSYLTPGAEPGADDRRVIRRAIDAARRRNPALDRSVFDFIHEVLLPSADNPHPVAEDARQQFALKFQQCTGPITAKGVEDTSFYIFNRLIALNEVGGEPAIFGASVETFHAQNAARRAEFPHCLLATSTHDTKRSEDVRARIAALSEMPHIWTQAVRRWHMLNRKLKWAADAGEFAPDKNEEYLIYQTLIGSLPLELLDGEAIWEAEDAAWTSYVERIQHYLEKAIREAKVNSSWIDPNQAWEAALREFISGILTRKRRNRFLHSLLPIARETAQLGAINSLAQVVLKITVPGVPDFYQGNEAWDFSLVDPDNRRPVDYERRKEMLASLERTPSPAELLENWKDGRIKLFVTQRLLHFRRENAALFRDGGYVPLSVRGEFAESAIAFAREHGGQRIAVVVPRLSSRVGFPPIGEKWRDTAVEADGQWRNLFTGETVSGSTLPLSAALREFPVAVLVG
jgi:(1->4)-alpha-D-glucan 1-alpha-D-glucosylmutase